MAKIKISNKNNQITVTGKLESNEEINLREIDLLGRNQFRGFMRIESADPKKKKIVYTASANIALSEYIQKSISINKFFFIIVQSLEFVKKCEENKLFLKNILLTKENVFINEFTGELFFIYQPITNQLSPVDFIYFIFDIVKNSILDNPKSFQTVNRFGQFLHNLDVYSISEIEDYIANEFPDAYKNVPKKAGNSGFIAQNKAEYETHYSEKKEVFNEPTVTDTGFWATYGGTTVLDQELSGDKTTVLGEDESEKPKFPFIIREKTGEKVNITKPSFRIGKERRFCDYFICDNNAISRSHADIITKNGHYYVYDNNSTNKTYVDGAKIDIFKEVEIFPGAKLKLANEEFTFNI